jgi:hypothetical protein
MLALQHLRGCGWFSHSGILNLQSEIPRGWGVGGPAFCERALIHPCRMPAPKKS